MFNAYLFCINHKFSSEDLGEYFKRKLLSTCSTLKISDMYNLVYS